MNSPWKSVLRPLLLCLALAAGIGVGRAEDGYRLWLRYDRIGNDALRRSYAAALGEIVIADPGTGTGGATLAAARDELTTGLAGLLGAPLRVVTAPDRDGALVVALASDPTLARWITPVDRRAAGDEGYILRRIVVDGQHRVVLTANREIGLLYGAFALLRHLQMEQPLETLDVISAPKIRRRMLNHWDNLDGTVERGQAGQSLWEWFRLPDIINPRYRDYARANASIGINGAVLNNVNANSLILTRPYLVKVAALADIFRPYGIRVYLSVRFSAPIEIGGMKTDDPLDPAVGRWWAGKAAEIYQLIPDFGGFLVKANSEGQPGPQDYGRTHADGANVMADALAPHGGVVIWRAFVYSDKNHEDRARQAYDEFRPLDGKFRPNVVIQVKNGPIDFMPREPFHPLFGAMPHTNVGLECQITQEYLGGSAQVAFLAPLWKEVLESDTQRPGPGATVARVIDGSLDSHRLTMMAGVANIGSDRNWCGEPMAAANWYAFGRLTWDHTLSAHAIADEWTRMTFSNDPRVVQPVTKILLESREAVVNYSMPLGLHHIMASGHHYGPGPWVDNLKRRDWNPVYYHRADAEGLGFDRTASGSNAVSAYAPAVAARWSNLATCPDQFLLWFHHVPWDYRMRSGRTMWDELCLHYQAGIDTVRSWEKTWASLQPFIDAERWLYMKQLFKRQEHDACIWRDACLQYFQTFSKRPLPPGVEPPAHPLAYYESMQLHFVPGDPEQK